MIKSGLASRPAIAGKFQSLVRAKWIFALVAAGLVTAANAQSGQIPDEQYIHIMAVIDRADALRKAGRTEEAHAKYVEAEKALLAFKNANPLFSPKTVAYRLKEVTDRADYRPPVAPMTNSAAKPSTSLEANSAAAAKSGVKLVEPGSEPRTALRYHVKAGDKQTAIMTMKVKIDMGSMAGPDGKPMAMPTIPTIPTMSIPMDVTVQNVAANGDITYETVMGAASIAQDATLPPQAVQGMQQALEGIKGLTTTSVMSNRGQVKKVDFKASAGADMQARQFMDQMKEGTSNMSVPFPEEAVGAGAKWEIKRTTKVQTTSVQQTGTYELVSIEGDHLSTKFTVGFDAAATQGAAAMQMGGNSTGTANLDLTRVVGPSTELNMHMEVPMGKDKSQVMKMDITMSIEAH